MAALADTDRLLTDIASGRPPTGDAVAALLAMWRADIDTEPLPEFTLPPKTTRPGLQVGEPSPGRVTSDGCAFCAHVGHIDYTAGPDADLRPGGGTNHQEPPMPVDTPTEPLARVRTTLSRPADPPRIHPDYRALLDEPLPAFEPKTWDSLAVLLAVAVLAALLVAASVLT